MVDKNGNIIGVDRVRLPFNSRMTEIFQGSDLNEIVTEMFAYMKMQIKNPALEHNGFRFDEFHQLKLTQGSFHVPLPSWILSKKPVINHKNEDDKCFKWAVIVALHHKEINSHPERIGNIRECINNYSWTGLEFPVAIEKIDKFEKNNYISINVLGVIGQKIYICRKLKYNNGKMLLSYY